MHKALKLILILCFSLGASLLHAQHYVGVRGGWGGGSVRFTPKQETAMQWGLYSGGLTYKFYSDVKYVGAIQLDLQYIGKGYVTLERTGADTSYHRTINSFEMPFMWQPHFYFFQRHARFFINLGVQFSYNMNSKEWYESKQQGVYGERKYPMKLVRDVRFGYGLCGGAGISVLAGRWDITLEARYNFGYSDILRSKIKYELNPYTNSPLDNINFSMAVYYRLGKGGLRSAPSKRMAVRMEEAEARRILRRQQKAGITPLSPVDSILMREIDTILDTPLNLPGHDPGPASRPAQTDDELGPNLPQKTAPDNGAAPGREPGNSGTEAPAPKETAPASGKAPAPGETGTALAQAFSETEPREILRN